MKMLSQKLKIKSQKYTLRNKKFLGLFVLCFVVLFSIVSLVVFVSSAKAAIGINRQINFQGKLVDSNGLNVADSTYTVVFSLYSVSSAGSALWTETDSVTTKAGIFQVALGATTALPDNVYFNSDSLYLGIKVGSDAEMTPRIRFTAVPYAINAASLNGVTATQSASGFTLTGGTSTQKTLTLNDNTTLNNGGLTFANGRTVTVSGADITIGSTIQPTAAGGLTIDTNGANALGIGTSANSITFGGSNNPTYLFSGTGGLTVNGTSLTLGNSSNATIQTTAGSNAGLTILSQGSGNITLGQNAGNGNTVIQPNGGGQAGLIINDQGSGDLFTASAGGITKFTVTKAGGLKLIASEGTNGQCLVSGGTGGAAGWTNCTAGNFWTLNSGLLFAGNTTTDFVIGGTATNSADFAVTGIDSTTPIASISAVTNAGNKNGLSLNASLSTIQSLLNNSLVIGGNTTGDIQFMPGNSSSSLYLASNGSVGAGTISPFATLDVRGNVGTNPIASLSGATTNAAEIVDQSGTGDLFTASKSGATKFVITNAGNVGIGTTTPLALTDIVSATDVFSNINLATNYNLLLRNTAGSNNTGQGIGFEDATTNVLGASIVLQRKDVSNGWLEFYTRQNGTAVESLALDNNGNVGVGKFTTNGTQMLATLDVRGNVATQPIASLSGATTNATEIVDQSGSGDIFTASVSGASKFTVLNNGNISFAGSSNFLNTITTAATAARTYTLPDATGTICVSGQSCAASGTVGYWQRSAGAIAPALITDDLLLGATATTSAKFAVINVAGGTPVASVSAGITGAASIDASGNIGTTNNQTLTLGTATTGKILIGTRNITADDLQDICFFSNSTCSSGAISGSFNNRLKIFGGAGLGRSLNLYQLSSGDSRIDTSNSNLDLVAAGAGSGVYLLPNSSGGVGITSSTQGSFTTLATFDVRALNATQPVASFSGATTFANTVIDQSGTGDIFTASVSGASKFTILNNGNISFAGSTNFLNTITTAATAARTYTLPDATGTVCVSGQMCATSGTLGYWNLNASQGTIFPGNSTLDFLVGGVASNSGTTIGTYARAGFLNIAGGTPIASLSAGTSGGAYFSASGTIQTTANQQLTLGGSTTGNVIINPSAGNYVGIGTQNPLATLDVRATTSLNGGTIPIASFSGTTSFAGMVVNNSGTGDLFTASSAGLTKFVVRNDGSLIFGGDTISASSSGATNNGSGAFINGLGDTGSLEPNSSFEASTSAGLGFADQWYKSSTSSGALSVDGTTAAHGSNSIKATLGAGGTAAFYAACIPLSSLATTYQPALYIKSTTGSPVVSLIIEGFTSKSNCINRTSMTPSAPVANTAASVITSSYTKPAISSTLVPGASTTWGRLRVQLSSALATTINIDAVKLVPSAEANGLDYAENYPADPNNVPQSGDVVALVATGGASLVTKANKPMDSATVGVVSTQPGYVLDDGSVPYPKVSVALAGRVPVNVSTVNGPIHVGDYMTSSDIPGVAVKATTAGPVIGTAMEDFDCPVIESVSEAIPNMAEIASWSFDKLRTPRNDDCRGKVTMFIKNTWYDLTVATASGGNYDFLKNTDLSVFNHPSASASGSGVVDALYTIKDGAGIAVTTTSAFAKATIANIQAGAVIAKEMSTDSLNVTTDNIMLGGQTINDYIAGVVRKVLSEQKNQPAVTVSVDGLVTATASAELMQHILSQQDLSATISGMTVTGVLGAEIITVKHITGLVDLSASAIATATLSAQTISADTIKANHIEGLDIITTGLQKDDARITALENMAASQSATVAPTGIIASPTAGLSILNDSTAQTTPSGDIRVKGNALVEGILHVVDTLFANNFITNGVSDFFGTVIFHTGVKFENSPTFSSDTAGIAVIKKDTDHVDVKFSKAYDQTPIVNASITLISLTPTPSETPDQLKHRQSDLEKTLLSENIHFVLTNRTTAGFTVLLDKPAGEDIAFSWLALAVHNPVIFQSDKKNPLSPSPSDAISPSPIDAILPKAATTSAGF